MFVIKENYKDKPRILKSRRGEIMKEGRCILVSYHDDVGKSIAEWETQGWHLNTYNTAGMGGTWNYAVNHYLLFERGQ
jgi:hypothetical protein